MATCFSPSFDLDNEIGGYSFSDLTESDFKSMIKPLGVVKKLLRLQKSIVSCVRLLVSLLTYK